MLRTLLIASFLLTLTSNAFPLSTDEPFTISPSYNFKISSGLISPGATDDILNDIAITYILKNSSSVLIKLMQSEKTIAVIKEMTNQPAGEYAVVWGGRDSKGEYIKDGLYEFECCINSTQAETFPIKVSSLIAKINVPKSGTLVRAQVPIFGIACGRNFKKYVIECAKAAMPSEWVKIEESTIPKADKTQIEDLTIGDETLHGNLATWDTGLKEYYYYDTNVDLSGSYLLRLTVFNDKGNTAVDEINVDIGTVVSFVYGGKVESTDKKVTLMFKEHSIKTSFILFNIRNTGKDYLTTLGEKEGYKLISSIYEIEPEGVNFGRPAYFVMHYNPTIVRNIARIAIYAYDPELRSWEYISTIQDKDKQVLGAELKGIQKLYAYYAIFERHKDIVAPVIYGLPKETQFNIIDVSGEGEPGRKVKVYVNNKEIGEAITDKKTGIFKLSRALFDFGENKITAKAVDEFGNTSPSSNSVVTNLIIKNPKKIKSLKLKNLDFKENLGNKKVALGESLFIELTGEDADKNSINTTPILIKSSLTDPHGMKILLLETGFNAGCYRAVVKLSNKTDPADRTLAIKNVGEDIFVESLPDSKKSITIKTKKDIVSPQTKALLPHDSCLCQDTFEEGFDEWENLDGEEGATLTLDNDATRDKSFCLMLENKKYGGSFGAVIGSAPYNVEDYPIVSFDYKIPPEIKINFLVKAGKRWYDIQFTDNPKTYEKINMVKIGRIDNVICDNEWHHAEFNLYEMLKRYTGNKIIEQMIMADYDVTGFMKLGYGRNPKGTVFYVDNFIISKNGSKMSPREKSQVSWEIGDNDNSNNEFLYEKEVGDDYYTGGPIEDFEQAVTKSDPRTNIHFYLSKGDSQKEYNFFIKTKDWDVRNYDYVDFNVLLNNSKIAALKCPYKDGTTFNIKIDKNLKEEENILTLEWKGGGDWVSWDYLRFEPLNNIKKPSMGWEIGYDDGFFKEFSHEMDISDDYTIGEDFKKFERAISLQDPITNIKFYLSKDMLNTDYEFFIKPFDIQMIDSQPKMSGAFFKILVNDKDSGTYNITPAKESLHVIVPKDSLKEGENIISLKWLAGCDWIMWDYLKFSPLEKHEKL